MSSDSAKSKSPTKEKFAKLFEASKEIKLVAGSLSEPWTSVWLIEQFSWNYLDVEIRQAIGKLCIYASLKFINNCLDLLFITTTKPMVK